MILKRVPIEWANVLEQPLRLVILDDKRAYYVNKKTDKPFLVRPGLPILMRIKAATELIWVDEDAPILLRYLFYTTLDTAKMGAGIFGSLGWDCLFRMFVSALFTENTYAKIEHKSAVRPSVNGEEPQKGFGPFIQDGPMEFEMHKCSGSVYKDPEMGREWRDYYKLLQKPTQNHGCPGETLCTAKFTFDFHYCHTVGKAGCSGRMLRRAVYSSLPLSTEKGECKGWFSLVDATLRSFISITTSALTPWYLRQCFVREEILRKDPIKFCVPGQKNNDYVSSCA